MKYIDLFCGIGGFHQALKKLGHECVMACDIDKNCREVYKNNYGMEVEPDIKKIDEKKMVDFDILCGGFPCQAFSNAGKKKTFEDDRGLLFDEIIRITKRKKTKIYVFRKCKTYIKGRKGEVIKYILNKLDITGYNVKYFKISPHEYGIPQQRERIYFVCVRKDFCKGKEPINIELPKNNKKIIFKKFLDKKKDIDKKYFINGDILNALNTWDKMIKVFEEGEKISPTIMINEAYNNHTDEDFNNYASWRQDYINKNKP